MDAMDDSILDDFLVDSHEGLDGLDRDLLALEREPGSSEPLASAFRALHTIKGTCSFLGLPRLERVAHAGESLLAALRAGRLRWTPEIADVLLATADQVRGLLQAIESTRREPAGDDTELLARLARAQQPADASVADEAAGRTDTPPDAAAAGVLQQQHLRIDVRRLDQLMDLVGELVLGRNQLLRVLKPGTHGSPASPEGAATLPGRGLNAAAQRIDQVTARLQDAVMRARMQPVSAAWSRLPRLVRDVASACGKRVRLETKGDHTELDRALVESLRDPLTHLVRNAIDHGIEAPAERERAGKPAEGVLALRAYEEGGSVHVELVDDGAGMSVQRIRDQAIARGLADAERAGRLSEEECLALVFLPGFSTASRVTRISGRGVGLDAARATLEAVGGAISLRTRPGAGTTFHIRLPLTLAIIPALTVEQAGECYAIPQAHLSELVRLVPDESRIELAHDVPVFRLRGELLPVVPLGRLLGHDAPGTDPRHLLVLNAEGRRFGLAVDRVLDSEDIVVKPLRPRLREGSLFAAATVQGDGRVALILDVHAIAARSTAPPVVETARSGAQEASRPRVPLLLVRARRGVPAAVRVAEVERVVEFEAAAFERLDDHPAVKLDGEALPLVAFTGDPSLGLPGAFHESRSWPVLVHVRHGRRVGLVVDAVEDIVDWDGTLSHAESGPRRIVLRDRITDLVTLAETA